jgi:hypothetical protein
MMERRFEAREVASGHDDGLGCTWRLVVQETEGEPGHANAWVSVVTDEGARVGGGGGSTALGERAGLMPGSAALWNGWVCHWGTVRAGAIRVAVNLVDGTSKEGAIAYDSQTSTHFFVVVVDEAASTVVTVDHLAWSGGEWADVSLVKPMRPRAPG